MSTVVSKGMAQGTISTPAPGGRYVRIDAKPMPLGAWARAMWGHREVLGILTRKAFKIQYKRASLGLVWALVVPVLQAVVMAVIFTKLARLGSEGLGGPDQSGLDTGAYPVYVLSGVLVWNYFSTSLGSAATAIADGAALTDKVWFPRAILTLVPIGANLVNLSIFVVFIVLAMLVLGGGALADLWLAVPGVVLLLAFTTGLALVLSAGQVYLRDIRFIVGATTLVWFYATPILYPRAFLGSLGAWLDLNPVTGVVSLFQAAAVDGPPLHGDTLAVSAGAAAVLLAVGISVQRRFDRLFVDKL